MVDLSKLTSLQNITLAGIGSTLEVFLQHPLSVVKNSKQYNVPIKMNLRFLYRGVFLSAGSASLITAVQFASYAKYHQFFNNHLSHKYNLAVSSLLGGVTISFFVTPFEMGVIQKCKHSGLSTSQIIKNNIGSIGHKFIYRGLLNTCVRDSMYVFGFLGLTPFIESKMNTGIKTVDSIVASTTSGIFSSVLSHPFDTFKTNQQYHMCNKINYKELFTIKKMFSGCFFRTARNCSCFFILNESNKFFINYI